MEFDKSIRRVHGAAEVFCPLLPRQVPLRTYFGPDTSWGAKQPRIALTAWGLHGSGAFDMNYQVEGAAYAGHTSAVLQCRNSRTALR